MKSFPAWLLAAVALGCWTGCVRQTADKTVPVKEEGHDHDHGHDHEAGPHGGDLIELGEEEYHAELAHDEESSEVTVYLLDGEGKKNVAIPLSELVLKVTANKNDTSYTLPAVPEEGEQDGISSRFKITSKELIGLLEHEAVITLTVSIDGKEFTGKMEHSAHHHDHHH